MRQITIIVKTGSSEEIAVVGDYVRIKSALVPVRIRDSLGALDATVESGDALNLKPFERLRVSHSDAADQTIVLFIGNGTTADGAKVGGTVSVSGVVNNGAVSQTSPVVTNASGLLLAAKATRKMVLIQNKDAGGNVYVNYAGVAASVANGIKIAPGAAMLLDVVAPTADIFAFGDIASNANVTVLEL